MRNSPLSLKYLENRNKYLNIHWEIIYDQISKFRYLIDSNCTMLNNFLCHEHMKKLEEQKLID